MKNLRDLCRDEASVKYVLRKLLASLEAVLVRGGILHHFPNLPCVPPTQRAAKGFEVTTAKYLFCRKRSHLSPETAL